MSSTPNPTPITAKPALPHIKDTQARLTVIGTLGPSRRPSRAETPSPLHFHLIPVLAILRNRTALAILTALSLGIFAAHLLWGLMSSLEAHERSLRTPSATPSSLHTCNIHKPQTTLLVGYTQRSRTSILDCYLRRSLATGAVNRVIFVPETGAEADLDWLAALVGSVNGYFILGRPGDEGEMVHRAKSKSKVVMLSAEVPWNGFGTPGAMGFARAWALAWGMAEQEGRGENGNNNKKDAAAEGQEEDATTGRTPDEGQKTEDSLYIFTSAETIFIAPDAIPSLIQKRITFPEYSMVLANAVNEAGLAWLHHRLGVVGGWRPETAPVVMTQAGLEGSTNKTEGKEKEKGFYPWRTSELPHWAGEAPPTVGANSVAHPPVEESVPTDFGAPIDFQPPFRGHRWLPYYKADAAGGPKRHRVPTLITEATLVQNGPGKWPWTAGAMGLYSLLEHLEEEYAVVVAEDCDGVKKGTGRYKVPMWEVESERVKLGFAAIWGRDLRTVGGLQGMTDETAMKTWIETRLEKSAVVDGQAIVARFVGGLGIDAELERQGLESTDLLDRFRGFAGEIGCWL